MIISLFQLEYLIYYYYNFFFLGVVKNINLNCFSFNVKIHDLSLSFYLF